MKKKFSRRFLSLALALLLVCQLAVVASAATRNWSSGSNKYYAVLTSSNSSTSYVNTPFPNFTLPGPLLPSQQLTPLHAPSLPPIHSQAPTREMWLLC